MSEEIDNPWTPDEVDFLYHFGQGIQTKGWIKQNNNEWLRADMLLTHSNTLRKLHCNCEVGAIKGKVQNMYKHGYEAITKLYEEAHV